MLYTKRSELTGRVNQMEIPVTPQEINDWRISGELIQNALPQLTPDQREFLLTGSTQQEWDDLFKDKE